MQEAISSSILASISLSLWRCASVWEAGRAATRAEQRLAAGPSRESPFLRLDLPGFGSVAGFAERLVPGKALARGGSEGLGAAGLPEIPASAPGRWKRGELLHRGEAEVDEAVKSGVGGAVGLARGPTGVPVCQGRGKAVETCP